MAECLESVLEAKPDWNLYEENLTDQSDEILALESFYDGTDCFDIIEEASKEDQTIFKLEFRLPVKTPDISLKSAEVWITSQNLEPALIESINTEATTSKSIDTTQRSAKLERSISGKKAHTAINCNYLPDISLSVELPCTYPSQTGANFRISSGWLNKEQLDKICKELDKIWIENDNMPILFTWTEWLSSSLFEFLDILIEPDTVIITPSCIDHQSSNHDELTDKRAISTFQNIDHLIYDFLRHNYVEEIKTFRKSMQQCMICFDEKLGSEFYRLQECKHHFCQDCMTDMCKMHALEGTIQLLKCPEADCDRNVSFDIMQQCLTETEFERLERLMLQRTLDSMDDVMYCPLCSLPIIIDNHDTHAMCMSCMVDFCQRCRQKWHTGECGREIEEVVKKLEEFKLDIDDLLKLSDNEIQHKFKDPKAVFKLRQKILRDKENKETKKMMEKYKFCPKCKAPIDKFDGCNKVICICGCIMCYVCSKQIQGYDHFSDGKCQLFCVPAEGNNIYNRVPAQERNQYQEDLRIQLAIQPDQRRNLIKCPSCHQYILRRANNNHLRCDLCFNSVCFCCKKRIVGSVSKHFMNSVCKQHGDA